MAKVCTQTRTDHVQDMCWFYVYKGRRYENNDIFQKMRACRPSPAGLCITINSTGLAAASAQRAATDCVNNTRCKHERLSRGIITFYLFILLAVDYVWEWLCDQQVAVAAAREHPFFVCGKGWSSCSPQKTMDRYGLRCKRLLVGDCCLSLSQVHSSTLVQRSPSDAVSSECRPSSETGKGQLEVPLDYSTVGTRSTELGPAGAESCRPGVIRSVPAETRRRRHRSSSESTAADMASTTPDWATRSATYVHRYIIVR